MERVDCLGHRSKCSLPHSHFLCRHAPLIARGMGGGGLGRALRDDTRRLVIKNPALAPLSFSLLSHTVVVLSSSVLQQCSAAKITVTSSALSLELDLIFHFTMSVKRYRATPLYIHIKYIPLLSPASSNLSKRGWWKLSLQNKTLWLV